MPDDATGVPESIALTESGSGRNPRGRLVVGILVCLASLVASAFIAEGLLRAYYREEEVNGNYWGRNAFIFSPETGYRHSPGFEGFVARRGEFVTPVVINSQGLRGPKFETQCDNHDCVLLLGDSFTFGVGVAEEQSFAALLRTELNPTGIGVVNGGQSGFSAEQERLFGLQLLSQFHPNLVIQVLFPLNDVPDDYQGSHKKVEVKFGYRLSRNRRLPLPPVDFLRTHSYLAMFLGLQLSKLSPVVNNIPSELTSLELEAAIAPTLAAVTELRTSCQARSIEFGVVIISSREGRSSYDEGVLAALIRDGTAVLDLGADGLFSRQDFFQSDGHWNEYGHAKAARYMSPFCRALLTSEKP